MSSFLSFSVQQGIAAKVSLAIVPNLGDTSKDRDDPRWKEGGRC
jgi:hypothetical protein